jgi:hypothetical protein
MAGRRHFGNGSLNNVGSLGFGFYWSSTESSTDARRLVFNSSSAFMSIISRAAGSSVRCLKD